MTLQTSRNLIRFLLAMAMTLIMSPLWAQMGDEDELLDPDDAFAFSAEVVDANTVVAKWKIDPRYYMYRTRISFKSGSDGIELGDAEFPTGKIKNDEFFGEIETYRGEIAVNIPLERNIGDASLVLKARSQGCADAGVCYPPHDQEITLTLPAPAPTQVASSTPEPVKSSPLNLLSNLADNLAGDSNEDDEFLDPEVAFRPMVSTDANGNVFAQWKVADGYYLYRDRLKFKLMEGEGVSLGEAQLSKGKIKNDEFFGRVEVYYKSVDATVPTTNTAEKEVTAKVELGYQGCADAGLCYPPQKKVFEVSIPASAAGLVAAATEKPVAKSVETKPDSAATSASAAAPVSEQDRIAGIIEEGSFWLIVASFFGFGLLLAFTPCVFPMIPILSSIIVGQGEGLTTYRAFILSLVYVLAMALTYTIAGVVVGMLGAEFNLQAAFQNPWILGSFVAVFVLLSLSMFGFYEIQLPSSLQSRLTEISNHQQGGSYIGVAIMGFLSALIVGPCVAPPLMGALIYIGQSGDAVLGGTALFALSMGMGAPLLAIGASAGKFLPRAGAWMDAVKGVFGVMLLAVGIWLLERIVPVEVTMLLWGLLLVVSAVYMGALEPAPEGGWSRLWKGLGLVLLIYGGLQLVGVAAGGKDWMQPLNGIAVGGGGGAAAEQNEVKFKKIKSIDDLNEAVSLANSQGKTVMLDFYADWCTDCKRMEKYTFNESAVVDALSNTIAVKADVTDNDDIDKALMKHFDIIGPPAILFFGKDGEELKSYRVIGFMEAEQFSSHIGKAFP